MRAAGWECLSIPGDIADPGHCRSIVADVVERFGRIDILVNNAAHQALFDHIEDISDEEWRRTFAVDIDAIFHLTKTAVPHMPKGAAIINTASLNADKPSSKLLAYATTKGAIQDFTTGLAPPVELASAYVMLAKPMSSDVSGATIAVTGGIPMI